MQTQLTPAAERIRLAMAPDPANWFFTGEVVDHGQYGSAACTCGHAVRYQFFIARASDGKRLRPSLKLIDRTDNQLQGSRYGNFVVYCGMQSGDPFLGIPLPPALGIPTQTKLCNTGGG